MQSLETIKSKSQESLNHLIDLGKSQPPQVQTWGVTGGAALVGAVALAAVAKGVLAIIATIANPPVALAVGALAGGVAGWSFMQTPKSTEESAAVEMSTADAETIPTAVYQEEPVMGAA